MGTILTDRSGFRLQHETQVLTVDGRVSGVARMLWSALEQREKERSGKVSQSRMDARLRSHSAWKALVVRLTVSKRDEH